MKYTPRILRTALACAVASAALAVGPVWADSAVPSAPASATELTATQAETLRESAASGDKVALEALTAQAEKGNLYAQFSLGIFYGDRKLPQDDAQSALWLRKAADQGYAIAQYVLATLYLRGDGVPQDFTQAMLWSRKAADQGNVLAQMNMGMFYLNGVKGVPQDYAQAAQWFRKAAEQNAKPGTDQAKSIAFAQNTLAMFYVRGQGVPQDYAQAAQWLRKGADGGDADAQTNLGILYLNGQGVPQDHAQAVLWVRKAAAQLNFDALRTLGLLYHNGLGVPRNDIIAYALFNVAATPNIFYRPDTPPTVPPAPGMTAEDIAAGNALSRAIARSGDLFKVLDQYQATGTLESVKK